MKFEFSFIKKLHLGTSILGGHGKLIHTLVNPSREWSVSLITTLLVASGLFAYAGLNFYEQYTDSNKPVVSEEHIPKYRAKDAELLIQFHDGRRGVFESLRSNQPAVKQDQSASSSASSDGAVGNALGTGVAGDIRAE